MNESFADATGARTVMYSAPQYRFSFLGSIMKSKNEKRPLWGKFNLNTFTRASTQGPRSSYKTSGEEGRQILGAKKVVYKYLDGHMLFSPMMTSLVNPDSPTMTVMRVRHVECSRSLSNTCHNLSYINIS